MERGKIIVVTKADVGVGAPYLVGAFFGRAAARAACSGPGTFFLATVDPNRAYAQGTLLDAEVIVIATAGSVAVAT